VIEETTHRIAKIIKGLRSFARDSDKDPFAPISIHHIVEQTLSLCQERFTFNGVSLRVQKTQENLTILSRSYQISQVLLNLLNNAFDAASESVEKWVEIEIRRDSNEVCIIVSDSGSGVPVLLQDKIMQPFFTTKPVGRGTGLGLSIALGIVTDHKGTLSLKSLPGGASFEINLPLFHGAASS
jgi:two-component system sensor histidine kinase DctS